MEWIDKFQPMLKMFFVEFLMRCVFPPKSNTCSLFVRYFLGKITHLKHLHKTNDSQTNETNSRKKEKKKPRAVQRLDELQANNVFARTFTAAILEHSKLNKPVFSIYIYNEYVVYLQNL